MKKRVSIYIDEDAWENLKEHAWRSRTSASAYLEGLICGEVPFQRHLDTECENVVLKEAVVKVSDAVQFSGGYSKEVQLGKKWAK